MGTDIADRDRPTAVWFRMARASQSWTVGDLVERMQAEIDWAPSRPNYSTYEQGHTVPKPETMARFYRFWSRYGIEPPDLNPAPLEGSGSDTTSNPDLSALASAIRELVEELRASRQERADLLERVEALEAAARLRVQSDGGSVGVQPAPHPSGR